GTTSPFASITPTVYVVVRNGTDFGMGQFAITDIDSSGSGVVDSWKQKLSIPLGSTDTDSDLSQLTQYMLAQLALKQETVSQPAYYAIENLGSGFVLRGRTNSVGGIGDVFLGPNTTYRVWQFNPQTLSIGSAMFRTGASGTSLTIPAVVVQ